MPIAVTKRVRRFVSRCFSQKKVTIFFIRPLFRIGRVRILALSDTTLNRDWRKDNMDKKFAGKKFPDSLVQSQILEQLGRYIVLDLETTGVYPGVHEVCELAYVVVEKGKITHKFESLVRTDKPMTEASFKIHGIKEEELSKAPPIEDLWGDLKPLYENWVIGHHISFDLGFLADIFMKRKNNTKSLEEPSGRAICTSLLSQALFPNRQTHKLISWAKNLKLEILPNHRSYEDTIACSHLAQHLFLSSKQKSLEDISKIQLGNRALEWKDFFVSDEKKEFVQSFLGAANANQKIWLKYSGGSKPGAWREVLPLGWIPNGVNTSLVSFDNETQRKKRYYLNKTLGVSSEIEV